MALIECPECKRMISDLSEECPNCGLPKKYYESPKLPQRPITLENFCNILESFSLDYKNIFEQHEYISNSKKKETFDRYYQYYNKFICDEEVFKKIKDNYVDMRIDYNLLLQFADGMKTIEERIDEYNNNYVERELLENKEYFDNILKDVDPYIKLDYEQRKAVVTDDDYCLLIAGAGSGKTTTMAAKVKWLVDKKHIKPEEIMLISYTNKAIEELKDRVNNKLNINAKISTFHSAAFDMVKNSVTTRPEVNFNSYKIIYNMLEKKLFNDKKFMRNLVLFLGYYFNIPDEAFDFNNLEEYHLYKANKDFSTLKGDLESYINDVKDKKSKYKTTLQNERMRSAAEVEIANFLYLNGIEYEYEKVYPHRIENARKEYTPDFYIFQNGKEAYIEHYGINQDYTSNIYTKDNLDKYVKAIEDKRKLHSKYNTKLIETWNRYIDKTDLRSNLEKELKKAGFNFYPKNLDDVYNDIVKNGKDKYIYNFIKFIV